MALLHLILAAVLWSGLLVAPLWSWGFEVHRLINGQAADLTPGPLGAYLQQQRNWLAALWLWVWEAAGKPTPPQSVWPWAYPHRGVPEPPDPGGIPFGDR